MWPVSKYINIYYYLKLQTYQAAIAQLWYNELVQKLEPIGWHSGREDGGTWPSNWNIPIVPLVGTPQIHQPQISPNLHLWGFSNLYSFVFYFYLFGRGEGVQQIWNVRVGSFSDARDNRIIKEETKTLQLSFCLVCRRENFPPLSWWH